MYIYILKEKITVVHSFPGTDLIGSKSKERCAKAGEDGKWNTGNSPFFHASCILWYFCSLLSITCLKTNLQGMGLLSIWKACHWKERKCACISVSSEHHLACRQRQTSCRSLRSNFTKCRQAEGQGISPRGEPENSSAGWFCKQTLGLLKLRRCSGSLGFYRYRAEVNPAALGELPGHGSVCVCVTPYKARSEIGTPQSRHHAQQSVRNQTLHGQGWILATSYSLLGILNGWIYSKV